jgi:hypothetical protein
MGRGRRTSSFSSRAFVRQTLRSRPDHVNSFVNNLSDNPGVIREWPAPGVGR